MNIIQVTYIIYTLTKTNPWYDCSHMYVLKKRIKIWKTLLFSFPTQKISFELSTKKEFNKEILSSSFSKKRRYHYFFLPQINEKKRQRFWKRFPKSWVWKTIEKRKTLRWTWHTPLGIGSIIVPLNLNLNFKYYIYT